MQNWGLALWTRILGVLLILLGLTLFASPQIWYTSREKIASTPSTEIVGKTERVLVIPRVVAVLVIGAGVAALLVAGRRS